MNDELFHLGIKALIQNSDGKLLLLKVNPDYMRHHDSEPYWDIPGGRMQIGETVHEALLRELGEETGIRSINSCTLFHAVVSNIRSHNNGQPIGLVLFAYHCNVPDTHLENIVLSREHADYGWFDFTEAADLLAVKYPVDFVEKLKQVDASS